MSFKIQSVNDSQFMFFMMGAIIAITAPADTPLDRRIEATLIMWAFPAMAWLFTCFDHNNP